MIATIVVFLTIAGVMAPAAAQAAVSKPSWAAEQSIRMRLTVWRFALAQRGKPYAWGGTGPYGFDCSGLVYAAYRAAGIMLPRTTYEMLGSWRLARIPKSEAQRGDLAFFGTGHVEIYDWGPWTLGAEQAGTVVGLHRMNAYWHPTMYFRIRLWRRFAPS